VLPRSEIVPEIVTAGGLTVGLRWPSHPLMQSVIRVCGFPLAAPSANVSNSLSPTNAGHVLRSLGGKIRLIVDGGQAQVGIESTVLDLAVNPPAVLRPGMIHAESLSAVIGNVVATADEARADPGSELLRSPGRLVRHYAPRARLLLLRWRDTADLESQLARAELRALDCHVIAHSVIPSVENLVSVSVIPHDAEAYARAIYSELHRCDEANAKAIVVERPPEEPEWRAIADRLSRAAR
jgi:L-threonylcarbamoyladenylate synthase